MDVNRQRCAHKFCAERGTEGCGSSEGGRSNPQRFLKGDIDTCHVWEWEMGGETIYTVSVYTEAWRKMTGIAWQFQVARVWLGNSMERRVAGHEVSVIPSL